MTGSVGTSPCTVRSLKGKSGRPSKALTMQQATAVLEAARGTDMDAYITLSLRHRGPNRRTARPDLGELGPVGDRVVQSRLGHRPSRCGARCVRPATPRPNGHAARFGLPMSLVEALTTHRAAGPPQGSGAATAGRTTTWSSAARLGSLWTRPTSGVPSEASSPSWGSTPRRGPHASSGTASCRSCPRPGPSGGDPPVSSAIGAPRSPRRSTASSSDRCSREGAEAMDRIFVSRGPPARPGRRCWPGSGPKSDP